MIKPIEHFAVNWMDGMKISQKHFDAQESFFIDTSRDGNSLALNRFNYGLLPLDKKHEKDTMFEVYNTATNDVQLTIKNCNAVTAAGYRISLSDYQTSVKALASAINENKEGSDEDHYILIAVNPFDKIAFGDLDPEEVPPRQPNTLPKYYVELVQASVIDTSHTGGNYLIIGKVSLNSNSIKADQSFIPSCTSIRSHPRLIAYHADFGAKMRSLQQYAFKIIQKTPSAQQNEAFAPQVKSLCSTLINYFADTYFQFRNIIPEQAPVYMIDVFARQALHLYNATQAMPSIALEEMLNYAYEWSNVAPNTLLNQLSTVAEINYDHNNCGKHFQDVENLLNSLERILAKLSDLDYIGQRKESIVVTEKDITPTAKVAAGWSVLD